MWHWNSFGQLTENGDTLAARAMRTSFWQKVIDAFNVFLGRDFYSLHTHYETQYNIRSFFIKIISNEDDFFNNERVGLADYATLFIPKLISYAAVHVNTYLNHNGHQLNFIVCTAMAIAMFILAAIFMFIQLVVAAVLTLISMPFIGIAHWIYHDKNNEIKQSIIENFRQKIITFEAADQPTLSEAPAPSNSVFIDSVSSSSSVSSDDDSSYSEPSDEDANSAEEDFQAYQDPNIIALHQRIIACEQQIGQEREAARIRQAAQKRQKDLDNLNKQLNLIKNILNNENYKVTEFLSTDDNTRKDFCKLKIEFPYDFFPTPITHHYFYSDNKGLYITFENNCAGHAAFLKFCELNLAGIKRPDFADATQVQQAIAKSEMYGMSYVLSQLMRKDEVLADFPPEIIVKITAQAPSNPSALSENESWKYAHKIKFFRQPEENAQTKATAPSIAPIPSTAATAQTPSYRW